MSLLLLYNNSKIYIGQVTINAGTLFNVPALDRSISTPISSSNNIVPIVAGTKYRVAAVVSTAAVVQGETNDD